MLELILGLGLTLVYLEADKILIYNKWKKINDAKNKFTNNFGKSLKLWEVKRKDYGYDLTIELPYSYTQSDLKKDLDAFKEGLKFEYIKILPKGNMAILNCVKKIELTDYSPIWLRPNQLLIAKGLTAPIIVDMNKFPHLIVTGDTGTGKSRLMFTILSNLIATTSEKQVKINLIQLRKNDLEIFSNCKQVTATRKDLADIRDMLKRIDEECKRRESILLPSEGYYSITDYKGYMPYIYVVIEEFSFLQTCKGDGKEETLLKKECLKYIKTIVNVGRASGVFLITALQKPTSDSIPADIKAQLTTRAVLRIKQDATSLAILGSTGATKLNDRQLIVATDKEEIGYTYTIDHDKIKSSIKGKEEKKIRLPEPDNLERLIDETDWS